MIEKGSTYPLGIHCTVSSFPMNSSLNIYLETSQAQGKISRELGYSTNSQTEVAHLLVTETDAKYVDVLLSILFTYWEIFSILVL